jgi:hypothetical protein
VSDLQRALHLVERDGIARARFGERASGLVRGGERLVAIASRFVERRYQPVGVR